MPACVHPDAGHENDRQRLPVNSAGAKVARALRCLACGRRFRVGLESALDALDAADAILRIDGRSAFEDMGAAWRKRMAQDRAKFERAMRGKW